MYLSRPPFFFKKIYPGVLCRVPTGEKQLFLTFDDGPIPEVTPWVLDQLKQYNARASFFCVGKNVERHPEIYQRIIQEGHVIGNHTYEHLNGWKTNNSVYLDNIKRSSDLISSNLFRPPYGRIKKSQYRLMKDNYLIVLWDVLSGDFDVNRSGEECYQKVIKYTRKGSIIVFHDSLKAKNNLMEALPRTLSHYHDKGFVFNSLPHFNSLL